MVDETPKVDVGRMKALLDSLRPILEKARNTKEEATRRGERYNIFNVVGLDCKEVKLHSPMLANLLDVKGFHGLGDAFLRKFLEVVGIQDFPTEDSQTRTEVYIGPKTKETGGRLDIVVESADGKKAVIIENKIKADDQPYQMKRYDNFGKENYPDGYHLLYLTLDGDDPTANSTGDNKSAINYERISYRTDILRWLEDCLQVAHSHPLVRETIRQYQTLIRQITNQDMEKKQMNELVDFCSKKENIAAALQVATAIDEIKGHIVKDIFVQTLKNILVEEIGSETIADINDFHDCEARTFASSSSSRVSIGCILELTPSHFDTCRIAVEFWGTCCDEMFTGIYVDEVAAREDYRLHAKEEFDGNGDIEKDWVDKNSEWICSKWVECPVEGGRSRDWDTQTFIEAYNPESPLYKNIVADIKMWFDFLKKIRD